MIKKMVDLLSFMVDLMIIRSTIARQALLTIATNAMVGKQPSYLNRSNILYA